MLPWFSFTVYHMVVLAEDRDVYPAAGSNFKGDKVELSRFSVPAFCRLGLAVRQITHLDLSLFTRED
jgi:hypothetical protein